MSFSDAFVHHLCVLQVEPLVCENAAAAIVDPSLNAPDEAILALARLALSCLSMPTSARPQMKDVIVQIDSVKKMYVGSMPDPRVAKVDGIMKKHRVPSLDVEIGFLRQQP